LGGQSSVLLRIAFGSDGSVHDEGFAFDDVAIYESPASDVGIVAITSPVTTSCGASNAETVCVTIQNFGSAAQSNIPVSYTIGTGTPVTETFAGPLAPGATAQYCFTAKANLSAGGAFSIVSSTSLASDLITTNNSFTSNIVITNPITSATVQDFEGATTGAPGTFPAGWVATPGPGAFPYQWQVHSGPTSSTATGPDVDRTLGTAAGKYVYTEASNGADGDAATLMSPCINLASFTNPGIEFWYHMAGPGMGSLEVQVSTNNGTTWTTLQTFTGPQQASTSAPWLKQTVSLAGHTGTALIRFRGIKSTAPSSGFSFEGDIAIDDVKFFNIAAIDAEVTSITLPSNGCGLTATETICISVKNNTTSPISNVPVSYQIGTNPPVQETMPGPIAPGATVQYCFTTKANFSTPGSYTVIGKVLLPSDGDPTNDTKTGTVTAVPVISTLPYSQNFENGAGGWTAVGTNSSWALGTPAGTVINSAASGTNAWVTNLTGTYNSSENSQVISPCFNFTGIADPDFEANIWWNSEFGWDGAVLQSSIDGGATWQTIGTFGAPNNWYNDNSLDGRPGGSQFGWGGRISTNNGSGGWVKAKHKLTGLGGQSAVLLRFAFGSDGSVHY
ncbi:MAG TPA: hypothetical protein VK927_10210, partial [Adhaeribacter sp.]|nr:hypothetical protein [Adhaeribacter sp.]